MKKTFYLFALLLAFLMCFTACDKNKKTAEIQSVECSDSAVMVVETTINLDKQYMFNNFENNWRWYETCIDLKDFLDKECDGTIAGIANVMQAVIPYNSGQTYDTQVVMITHVPDSTQIDVVKGFWIEDYALQNEVIKVTFKEAFDKLMAANYPKPHSRHCVLRKQIGPKDANPQYIFGNQRAQLYVDAVTGEVSDKNPAWPEDNQLQMPLGEWP